jgi:hypothetical protein
MTANQRPAGGGPAGTSGGSTPIVHGNIVIIILSAALLLAVGALVFGAGKIIYGIAHYYLRERKPVRKVHHPQLGLLTSYGTDSSLWTGEIRIDDRDIPFLISGNAAVPDERLVARLQSIRTRFSSLEHEAVEFLRNREAEVREAKLDLCCIEVTEECRPQNFTLEFADSANDMGVWRVEFVDGKPEYTGYED